MKELTLENVQVDCRELTEEQVKEMANVFENNGFIIGNLAILGKYYFLSHLRYRCCTTNIHDEKKTTITYDKFMELFAPKYEVKYIAEKPQHYSKGIDTFARMEANCTKEECLAFAKGNIDKYNWRTKGQDLEDFKKIIAYAQWAIKLLEK